MAAIVTDRLLTSDRAIQRSPLPESVGPPEGGWMVSTAGHLAHWAIFMARFAGEENKSPAETAVLLERALPASPINPAARLALAQLETVQNTTDVSIRSLGLSRDAVSLAWTARRLLAAGRKEDALKVYGRALSVAVPNVSSRSPVPRFIEDPGIRRYLLPGEEQVRDIVADLVSQNAWMFDEWSGALPETPTVLIATARLLREKGRSEADAVLDRLLENKATGEASGESGPLALAARAEAFALRSRWKEADQLYRQAIDSMADPTIARSWWFNLADISYRSDDETERQAALRAASAVASSDDITRRAADVQRASPHTIKRRQGKLDEHDRQIQGRRLMAVTLKAPAPDTGPSSGIGAWSHWFHESAADPGRRVDLICGLGCLGMFLCIFWDNLGHFYYAWTTDENYSHGFLVPLISLYFANQVAAAGPCPIRGGPVAGQSAARSSPCWCGWSRSRCRSRSWVTSPS